MLLSALAACSATPTESPSPSSAAGEGPTVPSSAPPTPTALPDDPATWTIGFDAVGPIALGDEIDDVRAMLSAFEEVPVTECPWVAFLRHDDLELSLVLGAPELRLVKEIVVLGGGPSTAQGIGNGSTFDDVRSAYPEGSEFVGIGESLNLAVSDSAERWLSFTAASEDQIVSAISVSPHKGVGYDYCN